MSAQDLLRALAALDVPGCLETLARLARLDEVQVPGGPLEFDVLMRRAHQHIQHLLGAARQEADVKRAFAGYVVRYPHLPGYLALDTFLLVTDWQRGTATHCYGLQTATLFDVAQAGDWAWRFPAVRGTTGHKLAEVCKVWRETRLTLTALDVVKEGLAP